MSNVGHTFCALHSSLRQLVERDDSTLTFNTGVQFKRTATKYTKILAVFNQVSVYYVVPAWHQDTIPASKAAALSSTRMRHWGTYLRFSVT